MTVPLSARPVLPLLAAALLALPLATGHAAASPAVAAPTADPSATAYPAPEWTALFDRTRGWTGADGIYSIPLSGDERPGSEATGETFFTFSDTFVGRVTADGERATGTTLVNNTNALLRGDDPVPSRISFTVRTTAGGEPTAMVVPRPQPAYETSGGEGGAGETWFWPQDGVVVDGRLYLFSLRMREGGSAGFLTDGISLLATPAGSRPLFGRYAQTDTPLFRPPAAGRGDIAFGHAVFPNTATAGAPAPDGYLYVYGLRSDRYNKRLLVSRVLPEQIADFSAYRFWDGAGWNPRLDAAVPVTGRLSSEFSVSPLADGRYIMVFQLDTLSNDVAVRYADSPVGPWSDYEVVYTAPEGDISPDTYVYNAKAHPHLSDPDRLLISYNVNTFKFFEHFDNADIYRPRFVWLPLG